MRTRIWRTGVLIVAALLVAAPASAADIQNFQVKTTADLVALCDTKPSSEKYVPAIHFCQGFGIGAWQYYQVQADDPASRFVCIPSPPPTRNEVMIAFVQWAKAHPEYMDHAPVDTLFRYLGETYPCAR
jgi:Ssp1 endopeptidase immunity protein Rap1a